MSGNSPESLAARHTSAKGVSGCGQAMMMERSSDLSPYPTGVAARLSAHCTFSFGRPGFLADFSGGGSWGRRHTATDGGIVGHWESAKG